jgi:hypothetical protein
LLAADKALNDSALTTDAAALTAMASLSSQRAFLFKNPISREELSKLAVLVGYNNASKVIVPNYRLEVASKTWLSFSQRTGKNKVLPLKNYAVQFDKQKGVVTSSIFEFVLQDQQKQQTQSLGGHRLLVKLPYAGRATTANGVSLMALNTDNQNVLLSQPFSPVTAEIVSVVPGNTANYGYVLAFVNELPARSVIIDWTPKTKKSTRG